MIKETLTCLDGPAEGLEFKIDRRLLKLYDEYTVDMVTDDPRHPIKWYVYIIHSDGLRYTGK